MRAGERLRAWRPHPLGRGHGPDRAERALPRLERARRPAEPARGHLGKQLLARFKLDEGKDAQTFAIGIKELWEITAEKAKPGLVVHTAGWPLGNDAFGGGFLHHLEGNKVTLGYVIGLDYANPWMSPFEEMQRWKTHPSIRSHIEGGKRLSYGARALNNGTPQALPKPCSPAARWWAATPAS